MKPEVEKAIVESYLALNPTASVVTDLFTKTKRELDVSLGRLRMQLSEPTTNRLDGFIKDAIDKTADMTSLLTAFKQGLVESDKVKPVVTTQVISYGLNDGSWWVVQKIMDFLKLEDEDSYVDWEKEGVIELRGFGYFYRENSVQGLNALVTRFKKFMGISVPHRIKVRQDSKKVKRLDVEFSHATKDQTMWLEFSGKAINEGFKGEMVKLSISFNIGSQAMIKEMCSVNIPYGLKRLHPRK